jgi:prevent-host-death family protein
MGAVWQLQEAKNRLSEVIRHAQSEGPQEITLHGKKAVVVVSFSDYRRTGGRKGALSGFFRASPLRGMSFESAKDLPREVRL